jgi:pimeloyl-ACP methyl ester carboxylesterase
MPFAWNDDIKIHYRVEGDGTPLVIHHGLTGYAESWRAAGYFEPLQENYKLILLDARGHGESSKPHNPEDYSMKHMVGDVVAILDQLCVDKSLYWGYSLGGRVGLSLCKYAPDRFSGLIIGAMGADEWNTEASMNRRKEMVSFFSKGKEAIIKEMEEASDGNFSDQDRKHYNELDVEAMKAILTCNDHLGYEEFLPKNQIPTLIYCGDMDYYYPSAKRCSEMMPESKLVTLPGLDHDDAFSEVNLVLPHVLKFLKSI